MSTAFPGPGSLSAKGTGGSFGLIALTGSLRILPFEDMLVLPGYAVDRTYDFAEDLLASQRKFTEDLLKATAPLMPGRVESAPAAETYKQGQIVPLDGTVESKRKTGVQDHVKAGTRFAPCSHHHEHSEGCTWQYV